MNALNTNNNNNTGSDDAISKCYENYKIVIGMSTVIQKKQRERKKESGTTVRGVITFYSILQTAL